MKYNVGDVFIYSAREMVVQELRVNNYRMRWNGGSHNLNDRWLADNAKFIRHGSADDFNKHELRRV